MLITQPIKGVKVFRTIFYIPAVISGVAVSIIWGWILNGDYGVLNYLLSLLGIKGPKWLVDPAWALLAVIIASAFGVGTMMLIFYTDIKNIPVIMLTAKGEEEDKVKGLSAGADDYVTKPFSIPELLARVKTQLRRAPEPETVKELVFADIRMDLVEKKVFRGDNYIHLGPTEFRLLRMLLETPGKVFSREYLLKNVWGDNIYVESRTVDVHIRRLRKSLNDFGPDYIRTVRATGYAIDINPLTEEESKNPQVEP